MKFLLSGAVAVGALLANTAYGAQGARFDLWIASDAEESMIAVSGAAEDTPFVVAAGPEEAALDLLAEEDAILALAELKARAEAMSVESAKTAAMDDHKMHDGEKHKTADAAEVDGAHIHKVVLVKKIDDDDVQGEEKKRIIKIKTGAGAQGETLEEVIAEARAEMAAAEEPGAAVNEIIETEAIIADSEDSDLLALVGEDGGDVSILEFEENGKTARLVLVSGASSNAARSFIDDAEGLDDIERAEMKSRLGL